MQVNSGRFGKHVARWCGLALLMCGATWAVAAEETRSTQRADDQQAILEGVETILYPGSPGPLALTGDAAFAIAVHAGDDQAPVPLIAGTRYRSGRAVAFGHDGYFTFKDDVGQTRRLLGNALAWVGQKPIARVKVGVRKQGTLLDTLRANGIQAANLGGDKWSTFLKSYDVVVTKYDDLSATDIEALTKYIAQGGGLLVAGSGWVWETYGAKPGENIREHHPGNRLCGPMGIWWTGGGLGAPPKDRLLSIKTPSDLHNASVLLTRLSDADTVKSWKDEDARLAMATIAQVGSAISPSDKVFRPQAEEWLKSASRTVTFPTAKKAIKSSDISSRAAASLLTMLTSTGTPGEMKASPTAATFPGPVNSKDRITSTITVPLRTPGWHSTGLYAAPGEVVELSIKGKVPEGLSVRIGAHKDELWHKDAWNRLPEITRVFPFKTATVKAANAHGGLIYIVLDEKQAAPETSSASVDVTIANSVPAPLFVLGKTDLQDWRFTIRQYPAPWAELATDRVILTVPTKVIRDLDYPDRLLEHWDRLLDGCADLAQRPHERRRPERLVADVQISAGYMHAGYPIMTHLDVERDFVNLEKLQSAGNWGFYHEIGHNHQQGDWTFDGTGEVTVNLFSLYLMDTLNPGVPYHEAARAEKQRKMEQDYIAGGRQFTKWKSDAFLALVMYHQLQKEFGWDAYKKVFEEYRNLPDAERPKNDDEKRDQWMVRFSRTVGRNLGPFFQHWGIPVSPAALKSIETLPRWMPPQA